VRATSISAVLVRSLGAAALVAIAGALATPRVVGAFAPRLTPAVPWLVATEIALCAVVAGARLHRRLARPAASLADDAAAIAGGDHGRRAAEPEIAELASTAASLNALATAIVAQHAQRARAEKMASVGRLAAGIAHEVSNPLGAINAYVHVLRTRLGESGELAEALNGVEREAARIDRITRGLIDYARPRTPAPTPIDVAATLRDTLRLLGDQGALRRVTVHEALDPEAPPVLGQRHDLEQLFVNLLLNAADAVPPGGDIVVRIARQSRSAVASGIAQRAGDAQEGARQRQPAPRVARWLAHTTAPDPLVSVVVADSGPGIAVDDRERVFEPFFTTKAPGKGTGLGLAIVANIVDSLGGVIWVEPAREGGAAFHMLFPAVARR
jgi:signal transduction histidine kinase